VGAAAPSAGDELSLVLVLDDVVADDGALVDGCVACSDSDVPVGIDDGAAGELSAAGLAGAVVAGADGVGVVVPDVDRELPASSPRVVVPDDDEWLTSADTGFCPTSSIPVTIAIATANTETA
jgi:hypothetical protein